jgi:integrase/predicted RNA-binding Zn-ribbon protein involved in translation (DUF1610 family)
MAEAEGRESGSNTSWKLGSSQSHAQPRRLHEPQPQPIHCPECGSERLYKDGHRYLANGEDVQRYLCRTCGYRFSDPQRPKQPLQKTSWQSLNSGFAYTFNRQACDEARGRRALAARKGLAVLAAVDPQMEGPVREGTAKSQVDIQGKILEAAWELKKLGYADATIRLFNSALRTLHKRGADLFNPETVKDVIARQKWSDSRRANVIKAYDLFAKHCGIKWVKPKLPRPIRKIPSYLPTEAEIDSLIAASPKKLAAFLQLLKETAMRCGEAIRLTWTDIDFERQIITLNKPEKGSEPRIWKVSSKLIGMLNTLPRKSLRVFGDGPINSLKTTFLKVRKRTALKLQNPRLTQISFHTLRHWKATMEYHRTKDILYVKSFLGHREVRNTEIYITIERKLFNDENSDQFHFATAKTIEEAGKLIQVGFEYVCHHEGTMLFRKRK